MSIECSQLIICIDILFLQLNAGGYYIQSMNHIVLNEQETKTIKYLNKSHELQDDNSESITEKQYEQQMLRERKKNHTRKNNQQLYLNPKAQNNKIVVVQALEQVGNQTEIDRMQANLPKSKHKKGKSMDIQEFNALSKQVRRYYIQGNGSTQNKGKITINNQFLNDFRERGSITQMKQYNISKKLGVVKKNKDENILKSKRKKSKSINEGQIKHIKRQIKSIIDSNPLNFNFKKKDSCKSSKTSRSNSHNPLKPPPRYSKSHEITTERKSKSNHREKMKTVDFKNIAQTMPITSKMVSLYSNTSSLFSSRSELQKINKKPIYIIPTEQSIDEIPEIRKYESLSTRKRSSQNLRKISLINQLQDYQNNHKQSTQNIISHYLELFNSKQLQFQKNALSHQLQISQIAHQNSLRQRNQQINSELILGSLALGDINEGNNRVIIEQSIVVQHFSKDITQKQEQLVKLNQIIDIIQKREKTQSINKEYIFHQIKNLIAQTQQKNVANHQYPSQSIQELEEEKKSKNDVSSSELKQSLNFQQSMQGVNLQILDKTLRERENYLKQRKDKQIQMLQQHFHNKGQEWQREKDRIQKWMNHQIKQVVHIRKQLWKGFNIAKNLITPENSKKDKKKNEMIKCLSDKYLARGHGQAKRGNHQKLTKGRINELENHKEQAHSSDIDIQLKLESDDQSDQQLLDSSAKLKNQFNEYKQKLLKSDNRVEFQGQKSSESAQSSQLLQPPTIGIPPSLGGLMLQKIQCQIDYQDSLNSQQMQALARESQKAKNQSLKIPYELSVQDKQDIYQFIFLDLCIELTDQYGADSTIMKKISRFIKNMKQQSKKQKGFKTNTNSIRDYLFQFITYLKNKPEQLQQVHVNLDKPLGPTALDILKYMHIYDEEPIDEDNNETVFILDIKLFQNFQQTYLASLEFEKYYDDQQKEKKRKIFLKNAIHIHNKAIFDALNETLDRQRPFGVWGQPFSWKKAPKFYHIRDVATKNSVILKSAQKTIQFGAYMCGFIADKEDSNLKNNPNVTQTYIDQIRDDRLSRLLANELDQSEEKMLFIDDQQTEILVEVSQSILQNLFVEVCREVLLLR